MHPAASLESGVLLDSRKPRAEKHTPNRDAAIAVVAARQYGVVTLPQLQAAGLDRSAITRRVANGQLHRLFAGVYAVGHAGLSREGRWIAAALAAGEGAALSHLSAGELYVISRFRAARIAVVSPWQRRPDGVELHRCRNLSDRDVTAHKRIPVTTASTACSST